MVLTPRVWLVTGSSSGFGRSLVELALAKGDNVLATCRKPSVLDSLKAEFASSRLVVQALDVTKPADISNAFVKAKEAFGRVDVVFNNAGYGLLAEVEGTPDDVARQVFETNFWGAANVNREAVRFFREANAAGAGGRLIVMSSFVGLRPLPCSGYYTASKHALEGLTDALAHEIDPSWNIKISLVEPGTFLTAAMTNANIQPAHPAYAQPTVPAALVRKSLESLGSHKLGDPKKAMERLYELASLSEPPMRLVLGNDALNYIRQQQQYVQADLDKYEVWSDSLQMD